jgi:hypothetical protein
MDTNKPNPAAMAETAWATLGDDHARAEFIEALTAIVDAALTQKAEARKGGAIPHLWYRVQWLGKANGSVLGAFALAARGG